MIDVVLRTGFLGIITDRSLFWDLICAGLDSKNDQLVQADLDQLGCGPFDKIVPFNDSISPNSVD